MHTGGVGAIQLDRRQRPIVARHRRRGGTWRRRAAVAVLAALAGVFIAAAALVAIAHVKLEPVLSGSMRPGIQPGDLAVIRPVPVTELKVGDVIAYRPPGQTTPVLHRIVSISPAGLVTQGDANRVPDPWGRVAPASPNVERLVAVVPKVGWLIDAKRTLLIVTGGALLLAAGAAVVRSPSRATGADGAAAHDSTGESAPDDSQPLTTHEGEVVT